MIRNVLLFFVLAVVPVSAQPDPYQGNVAVPLCSVNVYLGNGSDHATCFDTSFPLLISAKTTFVIPEVAFGSPNREAAYLVVVNPLRTEQEVLIEILDPNFPVFTLRDGTRRQATYVRSLRIPGSSSFSWDLRDEPLFWGGGFARFIIRFSETGTTHATVWPAASVNEYGGEKIMGQEVPKS